MGDYSRLKNVTDRYLQRLRIQYLRTVRLFDRHFDWRLTGKWMLYSAVVGVLGALGALVFSTLVTYVSDLVLVDLAGYRMPMPGGEGGGEFVLSEAIRASRRWLLFLIPTAGGLLSGWVVFRYAPEAEGHGTDAVIKAYHQAQGIIRPRVAIVKTLASSITIGTGGSAGQEGPIAQVGAAIGSSVANLLKMDERDRRMLLIAGVAAGVGSIFRSPLGGAFFAVEVLYREDIESEGIMPAVIAAITGYSIYSTIEGSATVFVTPRFEFINPIELLPLILLAVVCALAGILFTNVFYGTRSNVFGRMTVPPHVKPAIGGFVVGAIAFFFPAVLGSSYGWLQQAIYGNLPLLLMLGLAVAKIISTSMTIGSGGSGGVFAPSLVIGGMLGGAFGQGLHLVVPDLVAQPGAYVMIGMATFFTAVANVPITATIMISEMTGSYTLLVPLIFSGVIAHLFARRWSLYTQQVRNFSESPAHKLELTPELVSDLTVASIVRYPVYYHSLSPTNTLDEIVSVFTRTQEVVLPVVDPASEAGGGTPRYVGLVILDAIQPLLREEDEMTSRLIIAQDVSVPFVSVSLDDTVDRVLETFDRVQYPELPVVDRDGLVVAFLRSGQVLAEYRRAYLRKKRESLPI